MTVGMLVKVEGSWICPEAVVAVVSDRGGCAVLLSGTHTVTFSTITPDEFVSALSDVMNTGS